MAENIYNDEEPDAPTSELDAASMPNWNEDKIVLPVPNVSLCVFWNILF